MSVCSAELFHDALNLYENLVPVSASCFYQVTENARTFGHVLRGMDYTSLPAYNCRYAQLDPCHPQRHLNSTARVVTLDAIMPPVHLERSIYYQEFMVPLNMHYEAEVFLRHGGAIVAGVSLIRTRDEGSFSKEEIRIIEAASAFIERLIAQRLFLPQGGGDESVYAPGLTSRERDVAALVCSGLSNIRIAEVLGVRLPTVKSHLHNIFAKLDVNSRTALVARISRGYAGLSNDRGAQAH